MAVDVEPRAPARRQRRRDRSGPPVAWVLGDRSPASRCWCGSPTPPSLPWLRNLLIVFGSLLVEAMPFILLGATVSAAIEVLVPASAFARIALLPRGLQLPAAAAAGVAFPVCECGSVPVARRLAAKGLAPSAAVTFMLAAPIVNPVVVASTFVAYRGRDTLWIMVLGRLALGFIVAMTVGLGHGPSAVGRAAAGARRRWSRRTRSTTAEPRWRRFFGHLAGDVVFMARFLILGAALAAAIQTFVPRSIVDGVAEPAGAQPARDDGARVRDVALLGVRRVRRGVVHGVRAVAPQLAFLVFGPMVDLKLAALYVGTYPTGVRAHGRDRRRVRRRSSRTLWIQVIWGMSDPRRDR